MTEKEFEECEQAERQKHDEKVKELEAENAKLKAKVEKYFNMLEKSMDCETCKYYASVDENLEPCNSCFFDNSEWEIKEDD